MIQQTLQSIARDLTLGKATLASAESCTGGGVGEALTSLAGSSSWYLGGVISYSNQLKVNLLGVSAETLSQYGAVSEQVAREMVEGVARLTQADYAVSTTGIAGPDGGTADKPVGTVCFGYVARGETGTETKLFTGNREQIRAQTVSHALIRIAERISR